MKKVLSLIFFGWTLLSAIMLLFVFFGTLLCCLFGTYTVQQAISEDWGLILIAAVPNVLFFLKSIHDEDYVKKLINRIEKPFGMEEEYDDE